MRKLWLIALLLVSLLFFAGCVKEVPSSVANIEKVKKIIPYSSDGSDSVDSVTYIFEPWQYKNLTMQRILIVKQRSINVQETLAAPKFAPENGAAVSPNLSITVSPSEYKISMDAASLSRIKGNLQSFLSTKTSTESECKRMLGLDRADLPCIDMATCQRACYTPICQPFATGAGEPFVKSLLDLSTYSKSLEQEVDSAINLVDLMASDINNIKSRDIELLANRLLKIRELSVSVNKNDIFNPNGYGICAPFKYPTSLAMDSEYIIRTSKIKVTISDANQMVTLTSPLSFVSKQNPESDYYEYTNMIFLSSNITKSELKSLGLDDSLPSKLNVPLESVTYPTNYSTLSQSPLSVKFKILEIGGGKLERTFTYSFRSKVFADSAFAEKSTPAPSVSLSVVSLYSMPVVAQLLQNSNLLYTQLAPYLGFYISIAIIIFLFFVLFGRIVWTILRLIYALFTGIMAKGQLNTIFYDFAGHANKENNMYFIIGIVLLGAGYYLLQGVVVAGAESAIDPDMVLTILSSDPFRIFGLIILIFGLISFYLVIEDVLKGVVLGKKYTTIPNIVSHSDNVERFNRLVSLTKETEALMKKSASLNIDTSIEHKSLHSVPYSHIRNLVETGEEEAAFVALERYIARMEAMEKDLSDKVALVSVNSKKWVEIVDSALKLHREVSVESLVDIPLEWRKHALEEYMSLHIGENLKLDAGVLKRVKDIGISKAHFDSMLDSMKKEMLIDSGVVILRNGTLLTSMLPVNSNQTVLSAMSVKMVRSAFGFAKSLRLGNVRHTIAITKGAKILTLYNDSGLFMCAVNSQASMAKVIERSQALLVHLSDVLV